MHQKWQIIIACPFSNIEIGRRSFLSDFFFFINNSLYLFNMFTERLFIDNYDADIKMNSKSEYRQPVIPRIVTTREPPAGEGGEGGGRRGGGTGGGTGRGGRR